MIKIDNLKLSKENKDILSEYKIELTAIKLKKIDTTVESYIEDIYKYLEYIEEKKHIYSALNIKEEDIIDYLTYLDKNIYFDNFGLVYNKPIYFNLDNFYNLFDNFAYQLPESLNLNSFINCLSNIKEIKEANSDFVIYKTKTFFLNYNENKLVLRTDGNYILNSIFTLANEDIKVNLSW